MPATVTDVTPAAAAPDCSTTDTGFRDPVDRTTKIWNAGPDVSDVQEYAQPIFHDPAVVVNELVVHDPLTWRVGRTSASRAAEADVVVVELEPAPLVVDV